MSYPTTAYKIVAPHAAGFIPPISSTDAGAASPVETSNGLSTLYPTAPAQLGLIVQAVDPTYGTGEFMLLVGVASTVAGDVVIYDTTTYQTALLTVTNGKNKGVPVAVAMAACTAGLYGWYQVSGNAVIRKTAVAVSPSVPIYISATAGWIKSLTSTGQQIVGAQSANLATIVTSTSTVVVTIARPHTEGQ